MSIFSRIERRAASLTSPRSVWDQEVERPLRAEATGIDITPERARTLAAVWSCQSLIADGVASLPLDVYRRAGGRRRQVDPPSWLKTPNPFDISSYAFFHKVMISLIGQDGNAFILTQRDSGGRIVSVWAVDPREVTVDEDSPTPIYNYRGQFLGPEEMLHIPAFTVPGYRRGISVIDYARGAIGLGLAAEEFGGRFFTQGTTMAGVVEHPGNPKPAEVAILGRMLKKTHAGLRNSHAVGILTGGATWKSISITPEQAQFLETRRFQNIQIAQLYRVPPHLIDPSVQSSWGTGIEEQNKFFVDFTLVPWLTRLEQSFSKLLPNGQYLKFKVDARLRARTIERFQAYVAAVTNGIMSLDEVRALEDLEPIPGGLGKVYLRPLNLIELGQESPESNQPEGGDNQSD